MDAIHDQYSSDDGNLDKAASLNVRRSTNHQLRDGSLIQFRAMVQDMFDPEFYLDEYEVTDTRTNVSYMKSGRFRDVIDCESHIQVNLESPRNVTKERNVLYCISIPAENDWVKKAFADKHATRRSIVVDEVEAPGTSCKRAHSNDQESEDVGMTPSDGQDTEMENKRLKVADTISQQDTPSSSCSLAAAAADDDLNTPIADSDAVACIVKVYANGTGLPIALNECYHLYGVLSVDPALASTTGRADEDIMMMDMAAEIRAHHPPPSMVPRLHVIKAVKVTHGNPLIEPEAEVAALVKDAAQVRVHLHTILTQVLDGDSVAADYLVCHLIASVYVRQDVVCLGKFSLNLTNIRREDDQNFVQQLYEEILQKITTKSHLLKLSTSELNRRPFVPCKDYQTNRLRSGLLQLSSSTHLVVDETQLTPGSLDSTGVRNVAALKHLITWQKVNYDFQFNSLEFAADIPVLLISEGKSLLSADYVVPVESIADSGSADNMFEAVRNYLTPDLLNSIRIYLSAVKRLRYSVSDDMQKIIQEDFVDIRRHNADDMSADDLHSLLVLTRLMSLSMGRTSPDETTWKLAKALEAERKVRLTRHNLVTSTT